MANTQMTKSSVTTHTLTFGASDFDLTATNQTAQSVYFVLPANVVLREVLISKGSTATSSSATLSAFNLTLGTSAAGTQYLSATDVKGASSNLRSAVTTAPASTVTPVFVSLAPVGSGGNWSTLTFGSDLTVKFITIDPSGDLI